MSPTGSADREVVVATDAGADAAKVGAVDMQGDGGAVADAADAVDVAGRGEAASGSSAAGPRGRILACPEPGTIS
jgi:hypothetical protein